LAFVEGDPSPSVVYGHAPAVVAQVDGVGKGYPDHGLGRLSRRVLGRDGAGWRIMFVHPRRYRTAIPEAERLYEDYLDTRKREERS
jgi:hypothetical protein